ncbi:Fpg/Nei family DNA glycosylase [Cryobacterium sp. TmT2-59]|uniref:DNA-formamidopyrimidine glycosylase family protein n=1 Tax=unclassified Cryobacterium TaxID=2649013 RepID=UPI00106DA608|nr:MULTISPECIES: DNA-formamidopyrimidine glycosylase family protein [unclassified Cryobacterium]TFC84101.1 Fpg/Nei family DNA glycosylase [Cryobacterium sp. TmT2-59]TFD23197.1 Fpg/Nei family DNA glycosylase [Cryobacterium sp. TMT2-23]
MPEGDTVYRTAHNLDAALHGARLTRCDVRVPAYATVDLTGDTVHEVVSRGKHLLMRVGEYSIHSHLKMEGSWHLYRHGSAWKRPAFQARIVLETAEWAAVGFELGVLEVVPLDREAELLAYLGPDLLGADWDAAEATRRIRERPERPVAVALADQGNLAGLGNEYVNELCFLRGLLPTRPVGEATDVPALVDLARRLILANRDRTERITTGNARRGMQSWVFSRAGQPCRRCGTPIERGTLGRSELELRNTFWCPRCQT